MKRSLTRKIGSSVVDDVRRICRVGQIGGLVVLFASVSAQAQQPGYNTTSAGVHITNPGTSQTFVDPVAAQYNYPLVSGSNSGYVGLNSTNASGVPVIAAGAYANSTNGGWVSTSVDYATSMLVSSGTSGLANGSAVTLQMTLQLDGMTTATSGDDAGFADVSFGLRINAPDQAVFNPGDGWYEPTIMQFSADVHNNVDNFFTYYYGDPGGAFYHSTTYTSGWEWNSNVGAGSGGLTDEYFVEPGRFSSTETRFFDTGFVLIDFQTFVGDTLNIALFLDVYGDTYGDGSSAGANFLNTLQASINSPYANGLALTYGASASPVPVPAAIWLLASAMFGLAGCARRQSS